MRDGWGFGWWALPGGNLHRRYARWLHDGADELLVEGAREPFTRLKVSGNSPVRMPCGTAWSHRAYQRCGRGPNAVPARGQALPSPWGAHGHLRLHLGHIGGACVDADPRLRRVLEGHLDDLVRPAVLHEKVRRRVYRTLRKELRDLGYGWWRRWWAVRAVRKRVARMRREPDPDLDAVGELMSLVFEGLLNALI